jgi:hypothetical protein
MIGNFPQAFRYIGLVNAACTVAATCPNASHSSRPHPNPLWTAWP